MTAEAPPDGFWPAGRTAAAAITFDVDAESAILSSVPGSARRLSLMTHQAYGPRTGMPRLIRLLQERDLPATFFVPGYTAERWPDNVRRVVDAGYEIAHHGYLHEPLGPDVATEERYLVRGLEALQRIVGVQPVGYRAPNWETSYATPGILARHGFRYDSSLMDADRPYHLAIGPAPDSPRLVEIPISWALDDWEQYAYIPDEERSGVIESPSKVREMWTAELRATTAEHGCCVFTMHPFLSGRPARAAALADILDEMLRLQDEGLWIADMRTIAAHVERLELPAVHHDQPVIPPGW